MKLVHIEWNDAHHVGAGTWVDPKSIRPGIRIITIGFLQSKRRKHYTVVESVDEAGLVSGVFCIPKSAVHRYTVIAP